MTPTTSAATRLQPRIERARAGLERLGADWLLVPPSPDFTWLTGGHARSTERLVALALPRHGAPFCVIPRLEADALAAECPWLVLDVWEEGQDPVERLERRLDPARRPPVLVGEGFRVAP